MGLTSFEFHFHGAKCPALSRAYFRRHERGGERPNKREESPFSGWLLPCFSVISSFFEQVRMPRLGDSPFSSSSNVEAANNSGGSRAGWKRVCAKVKGPPKKIRRRNEKTYRRRGTPLMENPQKTKKQRTRKRRTLQHGFRASPNPASMIAFIWGPGYAQKVCLRALGEKTSFCLAPL